MSPGRHRRERVAQLQLTNLHPEVYLLPPYTLPSRLLLFSWLLGSTLPILHIFPFVTPLPRSSCHRIVPLNIHHPATQDTQSSERFCYSREAPLCTITFFTLYFSHVLRQASYHSCQACSFLTASNHFLLFALLPNCNTDQVFQSSFFILHVFICNHQKYKFNL